jgi:hypothetical protein
MLRRPPRLAAAVGLAAILTLVTPAIASARIAEPATHLGLNNVAGAGAVHAVSYKAHSVAPATAQAFPSATSTVIASIGFINTDEVGYFWSASRGDSVAQTLPGPKKIKKAVLKLDVVENALSGAETDWTLSINGTDVGTFVIGVGQLGPVTNTFKFAKMTGGSYDVKIRMTNEVPSGDGSITLRYAGDGPHSITLKK